MENEIAKAIRIGFEGLALTLCILCAISLFATGHVGGGFATVIFFFLLINSVSSSKKTEAPKENKKEV